MEDIQEKRTDTRVMTLGERIQRLEEKRRLEERNKETQEKFSFFKWPWKWRRRFKKSNKSKDNEILVIYLNKKNEVEVPKFMPVFEGNMVVWKNKPYEFDPRAVWTIKGIKGNPKVYILKEIDRRPVRNKSNKIFFGDAAVSNQDLDDIRARGDSTESDEFLIKAALRAQIEKIAKKKIGIIAVIILIIIAGGVLWFFLRGGGA